MKQEIHVTCYQNCAGSITNKKKVKIIFQKFLSEVNHSGQKIKIRIEKLWVVSYFST